MIGGGQLARMLAEPAAAMGIALRLLAEEEGASAALVIPDHRVGDYRDLDALTGIVDGCDVVTFDHEHVPSEHLRVLEQRLAVRPGPDALLHAQDKAVMRERLAALGVPCPRNAVVATTDEVERVKLDARRGELAADVCEPLGMAQHVDGHVGHRRQKNAGGERGVEPESF